jgi:histone-lysine N-methyltransferase SETD2
LTDFQKENVTELTNTGVAPLKMKSTLIQDTKTPSHATLNTIYNHRGKMRINQLQGRTPIEALVHPIQEQQFYFMIDSVEGHMTLFFFAHPRSLELFKRFPTTILLDCTYKTNTYNMPLLHIVGMNSCNWSFTVAFCFLSAEKEPNYT